MSKLVPLVEQDEKYELSYPKDTCVPVFPYPTEKTAGQILLLAEKRAKHAKQRKVKHTERLCATKGVTRVEAPVSKLKQQTNRRAITFIDDPWLEWVADEVIGPKINIIIGMPERGNYSGFIEKQDEEANLIALNSGSKVKYQIRDVQFIDRLERNIHAAREFLVSLNGKRALDIVVAP